LKTTIKQPQQPKKTAPSVRVPTKSPKTTIEKTTRRGQGEKMANKPQNSPVERKTPLRWINYTPDTKNTLKTALKSIFQNGTEKATAAKP